MRGIIRSLAERRRLIAACRASGLSAKAFAQRERIPPSTLYQWLADDRPPGPGLRIARVLRRPSLPDQPALPASPPPHVLIELRGARVEVAAGCDRPTLAAVLELLDARGREDAR
jgi:hypothetical protein